MSAGAEDGLMYSDGEEYANEFGAFTQQLAALGIDEAAELSEGEMDVDSDEGSSSGRRARRLSESLCLQPPDADHDVGLSLSHEGDVATQTRHERDQNSSRESPHQAHIGCSGGASTTRPSKACATVPSPAAVALLDSALTHKRRQATGNGAPPRNKRRKPQQRWTVKDAAIRLCEQLDEPKYYLMCQVVWHLGFNKTNRLLKQTVQIERDGGLRTADGKRRRSPGGVFLTLLRDAVTPEKMKAIYAEDKRVQKLRARTVRAMRKHGENYVPKAPKAAGL
ncbi:PHAX RNA-binding domain-containing protein [Tribonema minus]|uniref:Phosphorylated adapter RNA export protein n=1 Tax=Tribonema minus TaxID=303371 RepID=A0A835ZKK4_9STRA|nr:PHAX RNA-binding domain-containing protein [Tribonema minus]